MPGHLQVALSWVRGWADECCFGAEGRRPGGSVHSSSVCAHSVSWEVCGHGHPPALTRPHRALFSAESRVSPLQGGYGGRPCEYGRVGPGLGAVAGGALGARLITAPHHRARGGHVGVRAPSTRLPRMDWSCPLTLCGRGGGDPGRDAGGSLLRTSGQGRGARPCGLERAPRASASKLVSAGGSVGPPTTAGQLAGGLWSSLCLSSGRFVGGPPQGLSGPASCPAGESKVRKGSQAEEGRSHKSGGKKRHTSFPPLTSGQTASPPSW